MESLGTGARVAALEERRKRLMTDRKRVLDRKRLMTDRKRLLMTGRRRWLLMLRKSKGKGYGGEI